MYAWYRKEWYVSSSHVVTELVIWFFLRIMSLIGDYVYAALSFLVLDSQPLRLAIADVYISEHCRGPRLLLLLLLLLVVIMWSQAVLFL